MEMGGVREVHIGGRYRRYMPEVYIEGTFGGTFGGTFEDFSRTLRTFEDFLRTLRTF